MDLTQAIEAHHVWKIKLKNAIGARELLDAETLSKDNCCELGIWLYGEGQSKFGKLVSFPQCVTKHAAFHVEAGKVAHAINTRKYQEAEDQVDLSSSSYSIASNEVRDAITHLKQETELWAG